MKSPLNTPSDKNSRRPGTLMSARAAGEVGTDLHDGRGIIEQQIAIEGGGAAGFEGPLQAADAQRGFAANRRGDKHRSAEVGGGIRAESAAAEGERRSRLEFQLEAVDKHFVVLIGDHAAVKEDPRIIADLQIAEDGAEQPGFGRAVPVVVVRGGLDEERAGLGGDEGVVDDARREQAVAADPASAGVGDRGAAQLAAARFTSFVTFVFHAAVTFRMPSASAVPMMPTSRIGAFTFRMPSSANSTVLLANSMSVAMRAEAGEPFIDERAQDAVAGDGAAFDAV